MRSSRAAITLVFFADGLLIGSWAARIPAVQRQTELTSGKLGVALFAMSLGALLAMPTAGRLSERIGSRPVTLAALLGGGAALLLTAVAGGLAGLAAALFLFGAGFGAVNVAANAQGIALERLSEPLDPLVVPRGLQLRRPCRRRARRDRRRSRDRSPGALRRGRRRDWAERARRWCAAAPARG